MLRRESIWLNWLRRRMARRMLLPWLQAMRGRIDGALDLLERLEAEQGPPPPPPGEEVTDDLTTIRGIGPAIQVRLRLAGIYTFADLASRTPHELARAAGRSVDQVIGEEWIEQAGEKMRPRGAANGGSETPPSQGPISLVE